MDHLIVKYLQGKLTLEEQYQFTKWLEESPEHVDQVKNIELYWNNYGQDYSSEREEVKERIDQAIKFHKAQEITFLSSFKIRKYMRIAATILLLLTLNWGFYKFFQEVDPHDKVDHVWIEKSTKPGQVLTTRLPDGTVVKLNGGTSLLFSTHFGTEEVRKVALKGEAFFDVVKDSLRPFVVETDDFLVRVLGTSFDVKAYEGLGQYVAVKTGKVNVSSISNEIEELSPKQMVWVDELAGLHRSEVNDDLVYAWTRRELIFKESKINEVLKQVEQWFGVEVTLADPLSEERLYSARFSNPSLKQVLESISVVYSLTYEISNKTQVKMIRKKSE